MCTCVSARVGVCVRDVCLCVDGCEYLCVRVFMRVCMCSHECARVCARACMQQNTRKCMNQLVFRSEAKEAQRDVSTSACGDAALSNNWCNQLQQSSTFSEHTNLLHFINEVHVGDLRENDNQTKSGLRSTVLSLSLLNFRELVFGENAFQVKIKTQTQRVDEVVKQETRHRLYTVELGGLRLACADGDLSVWRGANKTKDFN